MPDIENLKLARRELAEMYSGVRFHGENGKQYWIKWISKNDWFFDLFQNLIAEELKRQEVTAKIDLSTGEAICSVCESTVYEDDNFCHECGCNFNSHDKRNDLHCESAVKTITGLCNGYCHSDDDDEPIDQCKDCKKHVGYDEQEV